MEDQRLGMAFVPIEECPEDFLLVIVARDLDAYSDLLQRKLHRLPVLRRAEFRFGWATAMMVTRGGIRAGF